ncbi:MAG: hypothetical protein P4M11_01215 [Candidatus Pacebacteria bacterium]|nr:hypothetical protein [Candidatus Paceibacterota bacterium]
MKQQREERAADERRKARLEVRADGGCDCGGGCGARARALTSRVSAGGCVRVGV